MSDKPDVMDVLDEMIDAAEDAKMYIGTYSVSISTLKWLKEQYAALKRMAEYGEIEMRKKYEVEAKLEGLLSQLNHIPSNHRTFDAYKQETLNALLEASHEKQNDGLSEWQKQSIEDGIDWG